jgi:hypothetical protein
VGPINVQVPFPNFTLTTEQQAMVKLVNRMLVTYPENGTQRPMRRLAAWLLEEADVAPQHHIAETLGYRNGRSVRYIRERIAANSLQALFNAHRSGRPGVVTQHAVIASTTFSPVMAINTRLSITVLVSTPSTWMVTANARCTAIPWNALGPGCAR